MTIPISPIVPAAARAPAVVTWNRLEGNPRTTDFARSLRAEVRDALWMLARQWQVGEFAARDAGSPVVARITTEIQAIAVFADARSTASQRDLALPLEVRVERERVAGDLRFALQAGQYWLRLLRARLGDDRYRDLFIAAYPLGAPAANPRAEQWHAAAVGRALDGLRLCADLAAGHAAASVSAGGATVAHGDQPQVQLAQQDLLAWFARAASQPAGEQTWVPERLEYQFGVTTRASSGATTTLGAAEYRGGHLDWHDFDVVARTPPPPTTARPAAATSVSALPSPVTFTGMPSVRWWEVEDQRLDFGAIDAHPTDLTKLLMMEFGLVYGSDWSIVPLAVPVGSLCRVTALVVSDVFGQQTTVPSLHADGAPWAMFTLSGPGGAPAGLFVPPALAHVVDGAPIECIDVERDEMANLVWAVETIVPDGLGGGVSGRDGDPATAATPSAALRYQLIGSVPPSWIPFVPSHVTGSSREIQLQRGAMIGPGGVRVRPRGDLLVPAGLDHPYLVHEEEVPRAGVRITRNWQRARWHDGRTYLWIGRDRSIGRGEGASGLAFDQVKGAATDR